ncbi:MAG: hypothetical protein ACM3XO_10375 [Bacteroidota bacterium]
MKTIFRIIVILLVAAVVAGAFSLAVNNSSSASGSASNGQAVTQHLGHPEGGDRDGGFAAGGLAGVFGTILKLTGITILVLALQKGWNQLGNLKLKFAQR